jgi:trans-aconitate 2-methyltransferase
MLTEARRSEASVQWVREDIGRWSPDRPFDLVFSNAALQWLPDHATLFPRLLRHVAAGGALAVQMPANSGAPYQRAAERVQSRPPWSGFPRGPMPGTGLPLPSDYYDYLSGEARRLELWDTEYVHVLPGAAAVVDWTVGTGLRPWLRGLPDEDHRKRFLEEYGIEIAGAYPAQPSGSVLFPFLRRFVVAYR